MKRWNPSEMQATGRQLFEKIHKKKQCANANHDVHFMAREFISSEKNSVQDSDKTSWLAKGIDSMLNGTYTPQYLKRWYFHDEMVDQLHLSDRIFQHILLKQLKSTFAFVMNPHCYHLRGPSGVKDATAKIRQVLIDEQPQYVIRADIKSFYQSIPHAQLIQDLKQLYDDPKLHSMLSNIIVNAIETPRGYKNPDTGIALRGPLSQFFSGVYLKPLDDAFDKMDVTYLRYQDDILILCKSKRQLNRCKQKMMQVLKERRLRLSSKKTRMGQVNRGFHFLGIHYPGTQTLDNTVATQAIDVLAVAQSAGQTPAEMGGGRQLSRLYLRLIVLFRIRGHYERHVSKLIKWSKMGFLPKGSGVT